MGKRWRQWVAVLLAASSTAGLVVTGASVATAPPASAAPPPLVFDHAVAVRDLGFADSQGFAVTGRAADVDGDGDADLPVAVQRNVPGVGGRAEVLVLPNDGSASFGTPTATFEVANAGPGPGTGSIFYGLSAHLANVVGSPAADLVVKSTNDDLVRIRPGNGDGTFGAETTVAGVIGSVLRFADVDGDGRTDVASVGTWGTSDYGKVAILRNTVGGWVRQDLADVGQTDVAFVDLAGDGRPSLLARSGGPLLVLPNDGSGVFGAPVQVDGVDPRGFSVGDLDGLGGEDVLVADPGGNLSFFANDGAGGLVKRPGTLRLAVGSSAVRQEATVDVDGDGRVDGLFTSGKTVSVVHVDPAGNLSAEQWAMAPKTDDGVGYGQPAFSADLVQLDGDGRPDLVAGLGGSIGRPGVTRALADPTTPGRFRAPLAFDTADTSGNARTVTLADLDEDGRLDLVHHVDTAVGAGLRVAKGRGDGSFAPPVEAGQTSPSCGGQAQVATADFDGDDNLDVLCLFGTAAVAFGDGAGHVGSPTGLPLNSTGVSGGVGRYHAIADFDVDGHPDVVFSVTNNCCPFGEPWIGSLVVQRYNPASPRTFVTDGVGIDLGRLSGPEPVVAGDFDADGRPDIVFRTGVQADGTGGERFLFLAGHGDGTFAAPVATAPGLPKLDQMQAGDVDGDGNLDVVGAGSGQIVVLRGHGDGTFAAPQSSPSDAAFDLTLADLNNDGRRDIVTGSWSHGVQIRTVTGAGVLSDAAYLPAAGERQDGVVVGDLDGDGRADIVSTVYTAPHVTVLKNRSDVVPTGPPDLRPTVITAPASATPGSTGEITYTVKNQGGSITGKRWVDRVYLSGDGVWDPSDRLFASVARSTDLGAGASYAQTVTGSFLPLTSGPHQVIVRTDLFDDVAEAQEANNLLVSPGSVDLAIPVLAPGTSVEVTLAEGQLAYVQVAPSGGPDQLLELTSATAGVAEVVAGTGRVPTPTDGRDVEAPDPASPQLLLPASAQTRFVLVRGRAAAGAGTTMTLALRDLGFEITSVAPDRGSNQGSATVVVRGAGFAAGATASLTRAGTTRTATRVVRHDATHLEATFDLTGLSPGVAEVAVVNPGGATATAAGRFTVTDEAPGRVEATLTNPGLMRTNRVGTATITVRNTGGTDLAIPLVRLDAGGGASFRPEGQAQYGTGPIAFFPRRAGGPTLALPPGTTVRIDVPFIPSNATITQVIAGGTATVQFRLTTITGAATDPFDWAAVVAPYRPPGLSDQAWADLVAWADGGTAPTSWADYVDLLGRLQLEALGDGRSLVSEDQILQLLVDKAMVFAPGAALTGRLTKDIGGFDRGRVSLVPLDGGTGTASVPVWSDGSFAVRTLAPGRYRVEVEGWYQATLPTVTVPGSGAVDVSVPVSEGQSLQGFVTRAGDGTPVAGAAVAVTDAVTGKVSTARSGSDGRYAVHGLRAASLPVEVTASGLVGFGPEPVALTAPVTGFDVNLGPGGGIGGSVTVPGGGPAAGAQVTAASMAPPLRSTVATVAADGSFGFSQLRAGAYTLTATRPGAGRVSVPVIVTDGSVTAGVTLALTPPATLEGTVRDQTAAPVAGVVVRARLAGGDDPTATTAADGSYRLDDLPAGTVRVLAEAAGHTSATAAPVLTGGATMTADLIVTRLGRIEGVVRSPGGTALVGVPVRAVTADGVAFDAVTGDDGAFAVDDLVYGTYQVVVAGGLAGQSVTVDAGQTAASLTFELDLGWVEGVVRDGAGAIADTVVYLVPSAPGGVPVLGRTDGAGRYRFPVTVAGDYRVLAVRWGFGVATTPPLTVAPGATVVADDLVPGGDDVEVTVTAGGVPVAGASVRVGPEALDREGAGLVDRTATDGTASFAGLAPGTYVVDVTAAGRASERTTITVGAPPAAVAVAVDRAPARSLRRTVLAGGQPVAGAVATLRERTSGARFAAVSGADGVVAFDGLADGIYDGWVVARGRTAAELTGVVAEPPPATAPAVSLDPSTTRLRGVLAAAGGAPVGGARVDLVDASGGLIVSTMTGPDGRYLLDGIPAVPVNVRVTVAGASTLQFGSPQTFPPGDNGDPPFGPFRVRPEGQRSPSSGPPPVPLPVPDVSPPPVPSPPPAELARSWLDRYFSAPQRDRRDDRDALRARLGAFNPNDCPEVQAAWIAAFELLEGKERAFNDLVDNSDRLFWQTLSDLTIPAATALKWLGKMAVVVSLGPELAEISALSIGLSPAQLAATEKVFRVLASGAVDLAEWVGILRNQLITGSFDAMGVTLQSLGSLASVISENAADLLAAAAPALGESAGKVAGAVGLAISTLSDFSSILTGLSDAIGTARSLLDQVAQTERLYQGLLERSLAALDALDSARAKGCACVGGEPRLPDGSCPPPPPPPPPGAPGPNPPGTDTQTTTTTFLNSRDPNAITGPAGQGAERFVTATQPLAYTVDFENVKTASAPAQEVVVTLPLDADLDASTFRLGALGWGSTRVDVPPDRRSFDTSVPLAGTPYAVQVQARLDLDTRVATWTLRTIDPSTGDLPEDPLAGFLPPNVTSPQGEGFVELTVDPVATSPPGTVIDEQASIVFDDNPAIATNTWTNTIGVPKPATAGGFHPVPPARILDTRSGVGGPATTLGPGETRAVKVTGVGGVPAQGVSAVAINVTADRPTAPSHLTVWPTGGPLPGSSNLNVVAGQTVPNLVVSAVGADGSISIRNNSGFVHVIGDVAGWYDFAAGSTLGRQPLAGVADTEPGAALVPLTPARILDTRPGTTTGGPATRLGAGETRLVDVAGRGGVPASGAVAVVMNVTAVQPTAATHLTLWPSGLARPDASNLNATAGTVIPNLVMVPLGADGKVALYNNSGNVDVLFDVVGYYATAVPLGAMHGITPARILDTRPGTTAGGPATPFGPGEQRELSVTGVGGVPASGVSAVVLNVTAVVPSTASFLTVWPAGVTRPLASNLNLAAGRTLPNLVVAKVGADGKVSLYNNSGSVHVLADVVGYVQG